MWPLKWCTQNWLVNLLIFSRQEQPCSRDFHVLFFVCGFKLKGRDILRGRYLEFILPLCEFTLKWSRFFPIGRISRLEKYVMFQHQICIFSRKFLDFVYFPQFWPKISNFWLFFNINGLNWWETDKVKHFDKNEKFGSWKYFFIPKCYKSSKIDSCVFVQNLVSVK